MNYLQYLNIDDITLWIKFYAVGLSIFGVISSTKKIGKLWRTRHLRKAWGIKDGDNAIVVCSELDEPSLRQYIEPREFIYNLNYGDVDAYFEVIITLLRLYPNIKLKVMSAGEVQSTRIDLHQHLILIGGPDYNSLTKKYLNDGITQYDYRSPDLTFKSLNYPDQIVIYDKSNGKEYCEIADDKDIGYIERIKNPYNPECQILFFGGCHTIGVTGAVKAISMAESEQGEIPKRVLKNAKIIAKKIRKGTDITVLISAERVGQTINIPIVKIDKIFTKKS